MKQLKPVAARILSTTIAAGFVLASTFSTPIWATEPQATAAPVSAPAAVAVSMPNTVPLVDKRALAAGLGALGGVIVFSLLTRGWGVGAMRVARLGMPVGAAGAAAARMGGMLGGRLILATAAGLGGALIGDYIYRSNHPTE